MSTASEFATAIELAEADETIRALLEQFEAMEENDVSPPPPPPPNTPTEQQPPPPPPPPTKVKSSKNKKRSLPLLHDENARPVPTQQQNNWTLKYPYDSPYLSWVDDSFQYSIQNPLNQGNILFKMHLYTGGNSISNSCEVYLDSMKDKKILSTINKLTEQLNNLWTDPAENKCINRYKSPLCSWRKPRKPDVIASSSPSSSSSEQTRKKKRNQ